jgi:alkylation response protein AidB-like acyl-CoA dehydrogenase
LSFIVHRRNLDFLLYELFDFGQLLGHASFAAYDRETISGIMDLAQEIAENEFLPSAALLDANEPRFVDGKVVIAPQARTALQACADAGLFAAGFPTEAGGLQLPWTATTLINGFFSCANLPLANYQFLTTANANLINTFGTEEQKTLFLPPLLAGRWFGTMCLSEPQAGSSLSDIRTRAEPDGNGVYRVIGSKMWISGGDHELSENIVHLVLARLPDAPAGVKGISLFIVPRFRVQADGSLGDWNNIALAGLNHKMGQRGTTNCLLNFGEGGDTVGYLVGEPHHGLSYMFHMMNEARIGVGTNAIMSALGGYLFSLDYARTRPQGRRLGQKDPRTPQVPIIEHADVRRMLLQQKSAVEGALALATYCMLLVDRLTIDSNGAEREDLKLLLEILTPVAKSWPSEHCLKANDNAIQVLGGYGYTRDYPVERLYRDNRLNHIHEGTFGIQGLDLLGRKVRLQDGRALELLLVRIQATINQAAIHADFAQDVALLGDAVDALKAATDAVAECADSERALANATIYLDAFGHVVIGWLWLRQALVAVQALELENTADTAFYAGKIAAFRYFFRYELPSVFYRFGLVRSLDKTCLDMRAEEFLGI